MAADSVNKLKLNLIHGPDKYNVDIELPASEAGDVLTVRHLAVKVEELTGVPPANQKLIFKGKSLVNPADILTDLGLKNNSKIMLIGKRLNVEDDALMTRLKSLESGVAASEKRLTDVIYEVDGIHRETEDNGYLMQTLESEALTKLQRRLLGVQEEFTRLLEQLDSLEMSGAAGEPKMQRKTLVSRIQTLLDRGDGVNVGLSEMILRLQP